MAINFREEAGSCASDFGEGALCPLDSKQRFGKQSPGSSIKSRNLEIAFIIDLGSAPILP
jgi:hypothetical protein